jgi:DNA-binding beta-propeller fold protein YncE
MNKKLGLAKLFIISVIIFTSGSVGFAEVEWNIVQTLKLDAPPLDMAISPDGRRIYVLVDGGNVLIYSNRGILKETIQVGDQIDQINLGPKGEYLFASSRQNKTLEIVAINFIYNLNLTGSPFKGAKEAPVVITVFSDFQ